VHACTEAAIALARDHELDAGQITRVRALIPAEVVSTVCEPLQNKRRPANSYDAQFSIPYAVATALRRARFTLDELEDEAITDVETLALADRVDYEIDPASTFPRHYSGEVIVTTRDGRLLRHREQINLGNGERPLGEAEILEKFRSNALRAISQRQAHRIKDLLLSIDQFADVNQLVDCLAATQ
jgi:2-methylcitrate dehydratase PrpD